MKMPRVVIVDAETAVRDGLPLLLPGVRFVGTFADVQSMLAVRPSADLVIFDPEMAAEEPRDRLRDELVGAVCGAGYRMCVYTSELRERVLAGWLAAGALGIVRKTEPVGVLRLVVQSIAEGHSVVLPAGIGSRRPTRPGSCLASSASRPRTGCGRAEGNP
jgi:DNA-binding NarL/FixJ family response regulator